MTGTAPALSRRMQRRGWHTDDPVYRAAWRAHEAMVELLNALHSSATLHAWRPPPLKFDVSELAETTGKKWPRGTLGNRAR